jgi:hypothetical protein
MAFRGQTGNVFRLRPGRGLTVGIRVGTQPRETMIMARAAAADGASTRQGDPFAVDEDRAPRRPGRCPRNCAALNDWGTPAAANVLQAD